MVHKHPESSHAFRVAVRIFLALTFTTSLLFAVEAAHVQPAYADGPFSTQTPYWLTNARGEVYPFGGVDYGSLRGLALQKPIVGMAPTPSNLGYWLVASDGGIFAFGDARFFGSTGAIRLNKPIVAMAPTPTNNGYWLIASDGGIFAYGDAQFYGSTGAISLNKPIVAMAPTPTNKGYWLIASDGGIFAYGDAAFFGSTGSIPLQRAIVAMAPTPNNKGYWLTASDGGIFAFGDAQFHGSAGAEGDNSYSGIVSSLDGKGYWLVRNGGDSISYGSAATKKRPTLGLVYTTSGRNDVAVDFALSQWDKGYIWGGNGPAGFDCSGLTSQGWKAAGVSIPRVAAAQYNFGRRIALDQLRPGDLLFFGPDPAGIDHVAMYVGGGWAVESGGVSKPSRVALRSVPKTAGRMMPDAVRPA